MTQEEKKEPARILILARTGFSFRYLVQSDVLRTLVAGGANAVVLSTHADESMLEEVGPPGSVRIMKYNDSEIYGYMMSSRIQSFFFWVRLLTLAGQPSVVLKFYARELKTFGDKAGFLRRIFVTPAVLLVAAGASRWRSFRRILIACEERLFPGAFHDELFEEYRPDLVIVPSMGNLKGEHFLLRAARRYGVKSVSVVLSWDNSTTRGLPGGKIDHVVAWTPHMRRELVDGMDIEPSKVFVGGVAHFDRHVHLQREGPGRTEWFEDRGLDPDRELICFGTMSPTRWQTNTDIIEILGEAIEKGRFVRPCQLLVRVHPIYFLKRKGSQKFDDTLEHFRRIDQTSSNIFFDYPEMLSEESLHMADKDMHSLGSALKHSDVLVSFFSTLNLEASIFDTPCVNIGFNGFAESGTVPFSRDIEQVVEFDHIQRLLSYNATPIANSSEDLIEKINAYLIDPGLHREERRRLRDSECGPNLGTAGESLGRFLLGLAEDNPQEGSMSSAQQA